MMLDLGKDLWGIMVLWDCPHGRNKNNDHNTDGAWKCEKWDYMCHKILFIRLFSELIEKQNVIYFLHKISYVEFR